MKAVEESGFPFIEAGKFFLLAGRAFVVDAVVLDHFESGRNELYFTFHKLPADPLEFCSAFRTGFLFFRKIQFFLLDRKTFQLLGRNRFLLTAFFLCRSRICFFVQDDVLFNLGFVKDVQLAGNVKGTLLAGRTVEFIFEILHLFLQVVAFLF